MGKYCYTHDSFMTGGVSVFQNFFLTSMTLYQYEEHNYAHRFQGQSHSTCKTKLHTNHSYHHPALGLIKSGKGKCFVQVKFTFSLSSDNCDGHVLMPIAVIQNVFIYQTAHIYCPTAGIIFVKGTYLVT